MSASLHRRHECVVKAKVSASYSQSQWREILASSGEGNSSTSERHRREEESCLHKTRIQIGLHSECSEIMADDPRT